MLSKMMLPDEAAIYKSTLYSEKLKNTEKSLSTAMKDTKINTDDCCNKKITKGGSNNWQKFKHIATAAKDDSTTTTTTSGQKSASKRQLTNSNNSTINNKRKACNPKNTNQETTMKTNVNMDLENQEITKQIAIDCEMVGVGDGTESIVARVSLVNRHGACIYDKYVKPREKVTDYRTLVSGIRPEDIRNGEDFNVVQKEVAEILKGRILVGHALKHDLTVLFLSHPRRQLRDTSRYSLFRKVSKGNTPSLKKLATELLGIDIQTGEHNSVEDARTAMHLYVLYKNRWESDIHK
ncbi:hypothetical protein HCN44_008001 [Aphidius gifuensis]|uniref:RNA exonuclease 4 n=2 Tax=Aphidius gifuensis TaxID=684658 RepID=A0A835CMJ1_APHGI|nr:RNA exonuclease 4 isoform X1 [Aphidius gifuensis]KAF7989327.1 hypothetical protein HCN44_008001 [Aphidius gifuensis]